MYPATNLAHYVDPVQDITAKAEQVFVQRTQGNDELCNTIVDVLPNRYFDGYNVWYVTANGDFIQGAPINPPLAHGNVVVGIINDDLFVVGRLADKPFGEATPFIRIDGIRRSDRKTLGGLEFSTRSCHVDKWMLAAPWAERLLPTLTDGVGSASAKIMLAEQFYIKRRAQAEIINQLVMRELDEELEELTENHELPTPTYGAIVTANGFLPTNVRLEGEALDFPRDVANRAGDSSVSTVAYSRVNVTFMYPGDANSASEVKGFSVNNLSRHAAKVLNAEGISISDPSITPALRGLSF